MRRRRATHMAAVEEEVERLSQDNSMLLHRMSQLVASHQAVDAENAQLRADLMNLRASVVRACPACGWKAFLFNVLQSSVGTYVPTALAGSLSSKIICATLPQEDVPRILLRTCSASCHSKLLTRDPLIFPDIR